MWCGNGKNLYYNSKKIEQGFDLIVQNISTLAQHNWQFGVDFGINDVCLRRINTCIAFYLGLTFWSGRKIIAWLLYPKLVVREAAGIADQGVADLCIQLIIWL